MGFSKIEQQTFEQIYSQYFHFESQADGFKRTSQSVKPDNATKNNSNNNILVFPFCLLVAFWLYSNVD